jgi:FAD/FMN-containing dehydrogenase
MKLVDDPAIQHKIWEVRESGLGATAHVPGEKATWEGWEDSAVPPEKLGGYLRDLRALYDRYGYHGALYGHFGDGRVHTRIDFDLQTHDGIQRFRSFLDAAADVVVSYGGSFSGEHGDGQSRAVLLPKMFGPELVRAFAEFKAIWDPQGRMNPGKLAEAYQPTENLRLGTDYHPPLRHTYFQFPDDQGSFAHATLR